mmetsp:Transcript_23043/g.87117  ORF Transcript_23043/g.87117 Transcript_23043/m.87117 type:complete len:353 (+) Transcript_23043:376-1434(+)
MDTPSGATPPITTSNATSPASWPAAPLGGASSSTETVLGEESPSAHDTAWGWPPPQLKSRPCLAEPSMHLQTAVASPSEEPSLTSTSSSVPASRAMPPGASRHWITPPALRGTGTAQVGGCQPGSHSHLPPAMQRPRPKQFMAQVTSPQAEPLRPELHSHLAAVPPVAEPRQRPNPLHTEPSAPRGHAWSQAGPAHPLRHAHSPVIPSQTPCLQSHAWSQAVPHHPAAHPQAAETESQTPWPEHSALHAMPPLAGSAPHPETPGHVRLQAAPASPKLHRQVASSGWQSPAPAQTGNAAANFTSSGGSAPFRRCESREERRGAAARSARGSPLRFAPAVTAARAAECSQGGNV